jgi:hypothetical protein
VIYKEANPFLSFLEAQEKKRKQKAARENGYL